MSARKTVSLFSGAMGLDLGLEQAGFETAIANDVDSDCVATMRLNRPDMPVDDRSITEIKGDDLLDLARIRPSQVDLVAGGPPCQSFSVFGNREGVADDRGQLVFEFVRLIDELQPKAFIMENVRGLLSMPALKKRKGSNDEIPARLTEKGSLVHLLFDRFNEIGYRVDLFVVNAVNYGAPQLRERVLLIGNRSGLIAGFPPPRYSNRPADGLPPFKTLGDAIGDGFDDPCPEVLNFSERKLKYLAMVPPGGNWRSLTEDIQKESMGKSWYLKGGRSAYWRRLSFKFPSPTVVTMPNHAGTSMCHPSELRAISVGEAMAIQEFPLDWKLEGNTASKMRQVGNAVPVRLGKVAGEALEDLLGRVDSGESNDTLLSDNRITHLRPHVRTRSYFKDGESYAGDKGYYAAEGRQQKLKLD